MKLIQLKLSDAKIEKYNKLVDLMGIRGTFGEYQKAIDFSIAFTISKLEEASKVLHGLKPEEIELLFSSIKQIDKDHKKAILFKEMAKEG